MFNMVKRLLVPVVIVALFVVATGGGKHAYATDTPLLDAIEAGTATSHAAMDAGLPAAALLAARAASYAARTAAVQRAAVSAGRWAASAFFGSATYDYFFGGYTAPDYRGLDESLFDF